MPAEEESAEEEEEERREVEELEEGRRRSSISSSSDFNNFLCKSELTSKGCTLKIALVAIQTP